MKLIKCHIENYGKLNNQDFTFSQGLSSFCFGNGYGKSTLVAFIKAMLYGMKSVRKGGRELEDREKYFPFGGGMFGGNITVSHGGKEYRIERFFDVKSDTKDTLAVFLNGARTDELGEDIGGALLGLDAESFERVMLMNSTDAAYGAGVGVSERLWGFDADGGEGFEAAYAALDARKRQIKAARGRNDELSRIDESIAELHSKIENSEKTAARLDELYTEMGAVNSEISALEEQKRLADSRSLTNEKRKAYAYRLIRVRDKRAELASITKAYPNGMLSEKTEGDIRTSLGELQQRLGAKGGMVMTESRLSRLSVLRSRFREMKRAEADLSSLDVLGAKCAEIKAISDSARRGVRFTEKFDGRAPSEAELKAQRENARHCAEAEKKNAKAGKGAKTGTALLLPGLLFIAAALCMLAVSKIASAVLAAAGLLMLTAYIITKPKKSTAPKQAPSEHERALGEFLAGYGYDASGSLCSAFSAFESELAAYLSDVENAVGAEAKRLESARVIIIKKANELAGAYSYPEIRTDAELREVRLLMERELREYEALLEQSRELDSVRSGIEADITALETRIRLLLTSVIPSLADSRLSADQIREITDKAVLDRSLMIRCKGELEELMRSAESYRQEAALAPMSETEAQMLTAGAEQSAEGTRESFAFLPEKRNEAARLKQEISAIEAELELTPDYRRSLASEEERRESAKHELKILEATMAALSEAEHNLSQKYIAPIKERFLGYASRIEDSIGERYTIDKKLNIRFDEGGASRDERHLSQGQHAVVSLALRLSLVDEMFGRDAFVILDDPFASLDDANFAKMRKLIESSSKTRQIVYFTCHNGRKI